MRRMSRPFWWMGFLACLVSACDSRSSKAPGIPDASANAETNAISEAPLTRDAADYGSKLDVALLPEDTIQMLERLPAADRELVEGFYRNYGRLVMAFDNKQELLWLIRQGYPMPKDVLEAATLSEQELQQRYDGGDVMAGYFMLDRKAAAAAETPPDFTTAWKTDLFSEELLARGGPFAGYAYYRYHSQLEGSKGSALAGLLWADLQGDYRAGLELMELTGTAARQRGEDIPAAATMAFAYQALLNGIRARNPAALGRRIEPLSMYKERPPGR